MGRNKPAKHQKEARQEASEGFRIRGLDIPLNAVLFIAVVCLTVYIGSLRTPFIFDDIHSIVENPYITSLRNIPEYFFIFTHEAASKLEHTGRPLIFLSFALNYRYGGLDPLIYHITNLAIHFLCAVMVYFLTMRLLRDRVGNPRLAALLAGLFFAVHPLQTESVSYIVGRSASLGALFYLAAFYIFDLYYEKGRAYLAWLVCLYFCLALLTKENTVTLPLMLIIYHYSLKSGAGRPVKIFFAVLIFLSAVYTVAMFYIAHLTPHPVVVRSPFRHWVTELYVVSMYLLKVFLPFNLNIDPDVSDIVSPADPRLVLSILVLALVFYGLYRLYKKDRLAGFFGLWFFIALIPETAVPLADLMAEHRMYLPLVGPAFLFGYALERLTTTRPAAGQSRITATLGSAIAVIIVFFFGAASFERNKVYASEISLWEDTTKKSPGKARPYIGMGVAKRREGKLDEAESYMRRALELDPDDSYAQYNLGLYLEEKGRFDLALPHYMTALKLKPDDYYFITGLANLYSEMGNKEEALKCFKRAIALQPDYPTAHLNLGDLYLTLNQPRMAADELMQALKLAPHNVCAHMNMGTAYGMMGKYNLAFDEYSEGLRLNPKDANGHFNIAQVFEIQGDKKSALEHYRLYLQYAPKDAPQRNTAMKRIEGLEKKG